MTSRSIFKEYFHNHLVQWMILLLTALHATAFWLVWYFIHSDMLSIYLRYNAYVGADLSFVAPWWWAYALPVSGVVITIAHMIFSFFFFSRKDRVLSHLFLFSAALLEAGIIIACVSIVLVNAL